MAYWNVTSPNIWCLVQLEEDESSSTEQRWMEKSGLWLMFHWHWYGLSHITLCPVLINYGWCEVILIVQSISLRSVDWICASLSRCKLGSTCNTTRQQGVYEEWYLRAIRVRFCWPIFCLLLLQDDDGKNAVAEKKDATHYSKLDPKTLKVHT